VIGELEIKNKRLTDMLNSNVYNRAQEYKENVLSKLLDRRRNADHSIDSLAGGSVSTDCKPLYNKENN